MKKEEKEPKEKNQEDRFSSVDSDEYGFEYEFFITTNSKNIEKKLIEPKSKVLSKFKTIS